VLRCSGVKISVLAFDLSGNAVGRAELLARLLAPRYRVSIVGPQVGPEVWPPTAGSTVERRPVHTGRHPGFLLQLPALLRLADGDLLYASKPRPTSFGVALLARALRPRPLLLDIDDWEVGFYHHPAFWHRVGRALRLLDPNGLSWTWLMEQRIAAADAMTVASRFLQDRFGGTLIAHARDTEAWDPARYDPGETRAALNAEGASLVMFLGTPRAYKGVDDLVEAVRLLGHPAVLALVGVNLATVEARRWASLPFVRVVGKIPFDDVPRYLMAADVVAVPQRATPATAAQVPAKLFDAMALARPIVSTAVSMIPEILDGCGLVVPPGDVPALAEALRRLLDDRALADALGQRARERCEAEYSFRAVGDRLFSVVDTVLAKWT
jgi:glycosyltransferase involved in cell wall biosynthesis